MPLPLLFIGIAVASGMFGVGGTVKAGFDAKNAKQINKSANGLVQESTDYLNAQRLACGNSLTRLGAEKMAVLNGTISDFLNVFTQIKNVDFKETEGLDELHRLHIDEQEFVELRSMAHFAGSVTGGAVAGTAMIGWNVGTVIWCCTGAGFCFDRNGDFCAERCRCNECHTRLFRRRFPCCRWAWNGRRDSCTRRTRSRSCLIGYGTGCRESSEERS